LRYSYEVPGKTPTVVLSQLHRKSLRPIAEIHDYGAGGWTPPTPVAEQFWITKKSHELIRLLGHASRDTLQRFER
jgi:hypothetical protein